MYELLAIPLLIQAFRLLDGYIKNKGFQKPYYAVHVVHNMGIVALTLPDLYRSFFYVREAASLPLNYAAIYVCVALHLYHVINYWSVLRFDDWLHHGLMIGVAIPLGLMVPAGALFGTNLFFTTGLPGAISYGLLFAERNGLMIKPLVQKLNAITHTWIRAPGCIGQAALTVALTLSESNGSMIQRMAGLLVAALTAWNGLYFMEQAIVATIISRPVLGST